ncbi:MAG: hypothetical protein ACRDNF_18185 [Streptosporangiaceae bacterium]
MGKSSWRKRQIRAKDRPGSILGLLCPELSPAEVAERVAAEFADWAGAGTIARMRLDGGIPVAEVAEASRLLQGSSLGPPGLGVLSFAASVAHAEGDEQAEHGYTAQMLTRAPAAGDAELWLDVVRFISGTGHPGEAIELAEPYLRDHLEDGDAAFIYALMLQEAAGLAQRGDRELAALERFADRSGLAEVKRAVMAFMGRTKWGELVQNRALNDLSLVPSKRLPAAMQKECAALAFEAAVRGAEAGIEGMTAKQLLDLYRGGHRPATALTEFAADPDSPAVLARRAADWAQHAHYGLWQMPNPSLGPGVWGVDLASGIRRYLQFPPGTLDGAAQWTVWLGGVVPVDAVWRVTGTGITLSPVEADAVAEVIAQAVDKLIMTTSGGMPLAEMLPPEPIPYGKAPPWGVRWDYFESRDAQYAQATSGTVMMLAARIAADVEIHRAERSPEASEGLWPMTGAWLDEPLLALHGLTPRAAAQADTPYAMLLESLLRQFEYQASSSGTDSADVARLRAELEMGGN